MLQNCSLCIVPCCSECGLFLCACPCLYACSTVIHDVRVLCLRLEDIFTPPKCVVCSSVLDLCFEFLFLWCYLVNGFVEGQEKKEDIFV